MVRNPWDDDEIVSGNPWDEDEIVEAPAPVTGAGAAVSQPFAGFNRGVDQAFRAVSGAGRLVTDRIFEGANALFGTEFDTSRPSVSPIREMQRAVSGQTYDDLPVNSAYDRYAQRIGEEVGASVLALAGVGAAGQTVRAASNAPRGLFGSAVQEFARNPGRYLRGDAAASVASGAGAQAANDIAPGNTWAEMAGQMLAPAAAFGVPAGLRGIARGFGPDNAARAQGAIEDAAQAGTTLTAGQLATRGTDDITPAGMVEAVARSTPGGNVVLPRVYARQQDDIARRVDDIAGSVTRMRSPEGAGASLRQGIDAAVQRFGDDADALYSRVDELIPANTPAPMSNARRVAQEVMGEAVGEGLDDNRVLTIARTVADENTPRTYQELSRIRTRVGRLMNDRELISSKPELDRLYAALTDDIADVARAADQPGPVYFHGTPDRRAIDEGGFASVPDRMANRARGEREGPFFFTNNRDVAATYADPTRAFDYQGAEPAILEARLNIRNPLRVNAGGANFKGISVDAVRQAIPDGPARDNFDRILGGMGGVRDDGRMATDTLVSLARRFGYDGIEIRNVRDSYTGRGPAATVIAALRDDQIDLDIARQMEGQATEALTRANDFYRINRRAIDDYIEPFVAGRRNTLPEATFREFELSAQRGPTAIRELRNRLTMAEGGQQNWDDAVGVVLQRLGRANPSQQGADGAEFSVETFLTNWDRLSRNGGLDELFTGTSRASMRQDLDAIARTAERMKGNFGNLRNPSGSGEAAVTAGTALFAGQQIATGNMAGAGALLSALGASTGAGVLMSRPWFVRWLAQSTQEPVERLPSYAARLAATAQMAGSEEDQRLINEYLQNVQSVSRNTP